MKTKLKYYYIAKNIVQTSFIGSSFVSQIVDGCVHVVYQESCMCGESILKGKFAKISSGKNAVLSSTLPAGAKLCEECERLYKSNGQLSWRKWIENVQA